ncbi:MAG: N-acetyltransferase [Rhodomicrobium sp.]|nr:MAG: N-acetyltransferase [Rhodomicrobium sp.]
MTNIIKKPITSITPLMVELFNEIIGPGRFARTAYRIREQAQSDESFGFNLYDEDKLVGTISFTPLLIGGKKGACLLGPLAIYEAYRGNDLGLELIKDGMKEAVKRGQNLTILVGDLDYYKRGGFKPIPQGQLTMPGPVDPCRLLAYEMEEGALESYKGVVSGL